MYSCFTILKAPAKTEASRIQGKTIQQALARGKRGAIPEFMRFSSLFKTLSLNMGGPVTFLL